MDAHDQLTALGRHMEWADAVVWTAVLASSEAGSDSGLAETLHHIHLVQDVFRQAWSGAPLEVRDRTQFQELAALTSWGRDVHADMQKFLAAADSQALERELRLPWASHFEQKFNCIALSHSLGESMLQVALHTAHHRGQVCRRLREIGGEPPLVDFIVWLWAGKPAADWACLERLQLDV